MVGHLMKFSSRAVTSGDVRLANKRQSVWRPRATVGSFILPASGMDIQSSSSAASSPSRARARRECHPRRSSVKVRGDRAIRRGPAIPHRGLGLMPGAALQPMQSTQSSAATARCPAGWRYPLLLMKSYPEVDALVDRRVAIKEAIDFGDVDSISPCFPTRGETCGAFSLWASVQRGKTRPFLANWTDCGVYGGNCIVLSLSLTFLSCTLTAMPGLGLPCLTLGHPFRDPMPVFPQ